MTLDGTAKKSFSLNSLNTSGMNKLNYSSVKDNTDPAYILFAKQNENINYTIMIWKNSHN